MTCFRLVRWLSQRKQHYCFLMDSIVQGTASLTLAMPQPNEKAVMEQAFRGCLQSIVKEAALTQKPLMEFCGPRSDPAGAAMPCSAQPLIPRLLALAIIMAKGKQIEPSETSCILSSPPMQGQQKLTSCIVGFLARSAVVLSMTSMVQQPQRAS